MLHDPKFWLAISFLVFAALMIKYVIPILVRMIDSSKDQVADTVNQAREMKEKAAEFLKKAEEYHQDSIAYSKKLVIDAKNETQSLISEAKKKVEEELSRKIALSKERIKQEEEKAIREMKNKIINSTIESIKLNFNKVKDDKSIKSVADKAIDDISKLIH